MRVLNVDVPLLAFTLIGLDVVVVAVLAVNILPGSALSLDGGLNLVLATASIVGAAFAMGLYQRRFLSAEKLPLRFTLALVMSLASMMMFGQHHPLNPKTLTALANFVVSAFLSMLALRIICCNFEEKLKRRVVFFGSDSGLTQLRNYEIANSHRHFAVVGSLTAGTALNGTLALKLAHEVQRAQAEELVIGGGDEFKNWCASAVASGQGPSVRVTSLSTLVEREARKLEINDAETARFLASHRLGLSPGAAMAKRVFDVIFSLALVLLTLPVSIVTAVFIKMYDGGPVFYTQERVGLHGRAFTLIKFRSMTTNAEADGVQRWACKRDARVTPFGRLLRLTRIDELPQLLNVLRGEMSVVGPRPERPVFVSQLEQQVAHYAIRHCVLPGITGWAQINYSYGASVEDAIEKTGYDLYYVKNGSLVLDIAILLQTVRVILLGEGSR